MSGCERRAAEGDRLLDPGFGGVVVRPLARGRTPPGDPAEANGRVAVAVRPRPARRQRPLALGLGHHHQLAAGERPGPQARRHRRRHPREVALVDQHGAEAAVAEPRAAPLLHRLGRRQRHLVRAAAVAPAEAAEAPRAGRSPAVVVRVHRRVEAALGLPVDRPADQQPRGRRVVPAAAQAHRHLVALPHAVDADHRVAAAREVQRRHEQLGVDRAARLHRERPRERLQVVAAAVAPLGQADRHPPRGAAVVAERDRVADVAAVRGRGGGVADGDGDVAVALGAGGGGETRRGPRDEKQEKRDGPRDALDSVATRGSSGGIVASARPVRIASRSGCSFVLPRGARSSHAVTPAGRRTRHCVHRREQLSDHVVGRHLLETRLVVEDHPVVQHRPRHRVHVFEARDRPTREQRVGPGRLREPDRRPWAGPVGHVPLHQVRRVGVIGVCRGDQPRDVSRDGRWQRHPVHRVEPLLQLVGVGASGRGGGARLSPTPPRDHLLQRRRRGPPDVQLEEEAVDLGLRQRVRPLQVDRVLARQHEERERKVPRLAHHRHPPLGHRLEHRRLRLGARPVHLIGEQHVGEDRPGLERHRPLAVVALFEDERAGDVAGHQVGRELHPAELEVQQLAERADEHRLADARHPLQQHVPARQDPDQHQPVQLRLAEQCGVEGTEHAVEPRDDRRDFVRAQEIRHAEDATGSHTRPLESARPPWG